MPYHYIHANVVLSRNLRNNATPQENHLWYDFLSKYHIRFQRQKPIDNYIIDFYCHKAKLAIELDGSQHYTSKGIASDHKRTETLQNLGIKVLRFTNKDIDTNFNGVCFEIDKIVTSLIQ